MFKEALLWITAPPPKKNPHTHDTNVHVWANEKKKGGGEKYPNNGILFSNENEWTIDTC